LKANYQLDLELPNIDDLAKIFRSVQGTIIVQMQHETSENSDGSISGYDDQIQK
jgi:hypothetical protein